MLNSRNISSFQIKFFPYFYCNFQKKTKYREPYFLNNPCISDIAIFKALQLHSWETQTYVPTDFFFENWIPNNFYLKHFFILSTFLTVFRLQLTRYKLQVIPLA